jgi:uncharacterized protein (TIGR02284 family)
MTTEETILELNGLIHACKDGELGYTIAAADVRNTELETVLKDYAAQRRQFVRDLQAEIKRLGGNPDNSGTLGGTLLCGWMDVKSALTGDSAAPIIATCETGEESAVAAFQWVANLDISGETRALVQKQCKSARETLARLQRLKGGAASGIKFQTNDE